MPLAIDSYDVPSESWQTALEIKRSKFLAFVTNASTRQLADEFIRDLRDQHPQANHVCWAYIAGSPDTTIRSMSDDGEPSGTAGMPMLKVLEYSGYGDIAVAVVRYFGGTKLGTGGLQRAYSEAVSQVLADLPLKPKVSRSYLSVEYDYTYDGAISHLFNRYDIEDKQTNYGQTVSVTLAVASGQLDEFKSEITNLTAGSVQIRLVD